MATKDDFTYEQWKQLQHGPIIAGVLVVIASPNLMGIPKESIAMMKAVRSTEFSGGASDLVAILVADLDEDSDKGAFTTESSSDQTTEELEYMLSGVVAVVDEKLDADVASGYKDWVAHVARVVAEASKEGSFLGIGGSGSVTDAEDAMLTTIDGILNR